MHSIDLTKISPVTDAAVAGLASAAAYDELAEQIIASACAQPDLADVPVRPRWRRHRRPLLAGVALAAAGAAALVVGVLAPAGDNGANSQDAIRAVSFVTNNGQITVIIRNPYADASWYNADFARHHLHIQIELISASPSFVGAIEYEGTDPSATNEIKNINKPGPCMDATGCTIGFTVPADFHGSAVIGIGRPARPGEQYETTAGSSFDPEEALHGLSGLVLGHPIGKILPLLAERHVIVTQCRLGSGSGTCDPSHMPDSWYIQSVTPWAPGQVIVWIGPKAAPPPGSAGQPGSAAPRRR